MIARAMALACALVVAAAAQAGAHTERRGDVQVVHPWVEPASAGAATQAHPTLVNLGDSVLWLDRVTSPVAGRVGMQRDGSAVDALKLAPGATLSPETVRFVLRGLKTDLPEGKAVPVTLHFRGMEALEVHMAIGRNTMNPEQVVEMPGHQDAHEDGHDDGHEDGRDQAE